MFRDKYYTDSYGEPYDDMDIDGSPFQDNSPDMYGSEDDLDIEPPFVSTPTDEQVDNLELYGADDDRDDSTPRILLMGLRRSGKSSIQKVVFEKMAPHETLFLDTTKTLEKNDISNRSFIKLRIWDFPGQFNFFDRSFNSSAIFKGAGALIFVIDAQDTTDEAKTKLFQTIQQAYGVNRKINFEVFIHKVDGIMEEVKIEITHDIRTRIKEDLEDSNLGHIKVRFHPTSIYDHSIFEAFSKVVQGLIPFQPTLVKLLDRFVQWSKMEKAFLIDVFSKIYIAGDNNPRETWISELCSDMIDVVLDVSEVYGKKDGKSGRLGVGGTEENRKKKKKKKGKKSRDGNKKNYDFSDFSDSEDDFDSAEEEEEVEVEEEVEEDVVNEKKGQMIQDSDDSGYDEKTWCVIQLNNTDVDEGGTSFLYLRQVNKYLALACMVQADAFGKMGIINYNFKCLKKAVEEVFEKYKTGKWRK